MNPGYSDCSSCLMNSGCNEGTFFYLFFLFSPKQNFQDKSCSSKNADQGTAQLHRDFKIINYMCEKK